LFCETLLRWRKHVNAQFLQARQQARRAQDFNQKRTSAGAFARLKSAEDD